MNPTTEKLRPVLYALAALLVVYAWGQCRYRSGASDAMLRAEGHATDSAAAVTDRRVAALAAREVQRESTLARQGRELAASRATVARLKMQLVPTVGTIVPNSSALKDSVIYAQSDIIRQQDSVIVLWTARAEERGELLRRALSERDAFQRQRDSFARRVPPSSQAYTDLGGAALIGYGAADKNETVVLVGAGVVLVPRVLRGIGRLF